MPHFLKHPKIQTKRYVKEKGSKVHNDYLKVEGCPNHSKNQVLSNKNVTVCIHLLPIAFLLYIILGLFALFYYAKLFRKTKVTLIITRFVYRAFFDDIPFYFSLSVYLFVPKICRLSSFFYLIYIYIIKNANNPNNTNKKNDIGSIRMHTVKSLLDKTWIIKYNSRTPNFQTIIVNPTSSLFQTPLCLSPEMLEKV